MQTLMSFAASYGFYGLGLVAAFVTGIFVQAKHPMVAQTIKQDVGVVTKL